MRLPEGDLAPACFSDGQGPVGVTCFPEGLPAVCEAARRRVFDPLVARLNAALESAAPSELSVWWAPPSAYHFTIHQISEHPSLLSDDERPLCRPLTDTDDAKLKEELASALRPKKALTLS